MCGDGNGGGGGDDDEDNYRHCGVFVIVVGMHDDDGAHGKIIRLYAEIVVVSTFLLPFLCSFVSCLFFVPPPRTTKAS